MINNIDKKRIDVKLTTLYDCLYTVEFQFGNSSNGNAVRAKILIDTFSEGSLAIGSDCTNCVNSNKYKFNNETLEKLPFEPLSVSQFLLIIH